MWLRYSPICLSCLSYSDVDNVWVVWVTLTHTMSKLDNVQVTLTWTTCPGCPSWRMSKSDNVWVTNCLHYPDQDNLSKLPLTQTMSELPLLRQCLSQTMPELKKKFSWGWWVRQPVPSYLWLGQCLSYPYLDNVRVRQCLSWKKILAGGGGNLDNLSELPQLGQCPSYSWLRQCLSYPHSDMSKLKFVFAIWRGGGLTQTTCPSYPNSDNLSQLPWLRQCLSYPWLGQCLSYPYQDNIWVRQCLSWKNFHWQGGGTQTTCLSFPNSDNLSELPLTWTTCLSYPYSDLSKLP